MKRVPVFFFALLLAGVVCAGNPISNVAMVQQSGGLVRIDYSLSRDSIVTVDFVTNGVSIGVANFAAVSGDVNRHVPAGARSFLWNPKNAPISASEPVLRGVRPVLTAWDPASPPDYMVVDLVHAAASKYDNRAYYRSAADVPGGVTNNAVYTSTKMLMRRIPAAGVEWLMGSATNEPCCDLTFECRRRVVLSQDFYMAVFPVTQAQASHAFDLAMNDAASFPTTAEHDASPRNGLRWDSVRGASDGTTTPSAPSSGSCLGKMRARTRVDFDLPTSAQWEFACRGGTRGEAFVADSSDFTYGAERVNGTTTVDTATRERLNTISWNYWNSTAAVANGGEPARRVHAVGLKLPNAYGLYDMLGNVWELCLDYKATGDDLRASFGTRGFAEPLVDPVVSEKLSSAERVRRGSSATEPAVDGTLRAARFLSVGEDKSWSGFRPICPLN